MTSVKEFPSALSVLTATITNGTTTSDAQDIAGTTLVGIQLPAAFTGTAITFQVATSLAGAYQTLTNSGGSALALSVSAAKFITLNPADFAGIQFFKLVSNAAEGATRSIELITRPV